jgi:predicted DNA-binding transcriptional regulator AlpA
VKEKFMNNQAQVAIRQPSSLCSDVRSDTGTLARQIDTALQILRMKQLVQRTKLSRATLYALIATDPTFPRKIKLSTRTVGYIESEVDAWIASRIAA